MKEEYFSFKVMEMNPSLKRLETYKRIGEDPNSNKDHDVWRLYRVTKFYCSLKSARYTTVCKTKEFNKKFERHYRK